MREEIHTEAAEKPVHAPGSKNGAPTGRARHVTARALQAKVELIIGLAEEGLSVATVPIPGQGGQPLTLMWKDPEGKGRSIGQRLDALIAEAEVKLAEQWEAQEE